MFTWVWMALISVGTAFSEWSNAVLDAAPESSLLVVWGALLLAASQIVRARSSASEPRTSHLLEGVRAPHRARTVEG